MIRIKAEEAKYYIGHTIRVTYYDIDEVESVTYMGTLEEVKNYSNNTLMVSTKRNVFLLTEKDVIWDRVMIQVEP